MKKKEEKMKDVCKCTEDEVCTCGDECNCNSECNCESEECTCQKSESENLKECLLKKEEEINEYKTKLMYKEAEFINFRKRKDEEVAGMLKYANQDLILEVIKSVDNFERAIDAIKKDDEKDNTKILTGIEMIYQELKQTLKKFGVIEISEVDVLFDEKIHNAVMVDSNPEKEDGIILEVMIKGYKLMDRVIRPAMVKVNSL